MIQLCQSRVLKRNIGEKWIKYLIEKNIENSRRSCYLLQQSLTHRQEPHKHFELHFFIYEIYAFYHINKRIISNWHCKQFVFAQSQISASFLEVTLILFLHVFSSALLISFSSYLHKKYFFIQKSFFLTYCENSFFLSYTLLNVSFNASIEI